MVTVSISWPPLPSVVVTVSVSLLKPTLPVYCKPLRAAVTWAAEPEMVSEEEPSAPRVAPLAAPVAVNVPCRTLTVVVRTLPLSSSATDSVLPKVT